MSPAFKEGEYVITRWRSPKAGDVVVFEHPGRPGFHLIKRVIGLGGQQVEISGGVVTVDGRAEDAAWNGDDTTPGGRWQIPADHVFVLGDARHRSADDSRTLGPIPAGPGMNVVVFRYWPPGRLGPIPRP